MLRTRERLLPTSPQQKELQTEVSDISKRQQELQAAVSDIAKRLDELMVVNKVALEKEAKKDAENAAVLKDIRDQ